MINAFKNDGSSGDHEGKAGSRRRPIEHGDMRWLILDLINERPRHGYDIIKAIEGLFEGQYSPSSGVIYPTLSVLVEAGLIEREIEGTKKIYKIADAGHVELSASRATVVTMRERIEAARTLFGGPPPELLHALGDLRDAITERLKQRAVSQSSLQKIIDVLAAATKEIQSGSNKPPAADDH